MSLIKCPECGKQISDTADKCPNCGFRLTPEIIATAKTKQRKDNKTIGIACLVGLVSVILLTWHPWKLEPKFTVLNNDVDESPGKTMVRHYILVEPDISESDLRKLLRDQYNKIAASTGYRYHKNPTVIAVYAYPSREHYSSSIGQWCGMLSKSAGSSPRINIHDSVRNPSIPEEKFGYSENQRKDIYKRIVWAEDRARREAERAIDSTEVMKQAELIDDLNEKYQNALAKEINLTRDEMTQIVVEGAMKNWPMPQE